MVRLNLFQRLGSFGFWGTFKSLNFRGLLVGSLAVGGLFAIASELAVQGAAYASFERLERTITKKNPCNKRALLIPRYKPDFVRNWEQKYGQQSS